MKMKNEKKGVNMSARILAGVLAGILIAGVVLSGGGAELYGLDKMISKVFSLEVTMANNPQDCVARGLSIVNNKFLPIKMRSNGKNITSQLSKFYKTNNKNKSGE